jgi:MOSC domain-containing protein YiiM
MQPGSTTLPYGYSIRSSPNVSFLVYMRYLPAPMKVLSVAVAQPRMVDWLAGQVPTGIYKLPVEGRVTLRRLNFDGDRQADLTVHGGPLKAVYCYPIEHYEFWKRELTTDDLPMASFGENLTTEGLLEDTVHLGDRFAIGTAEVIVTQPRIPCFKLGIKFHSPDIIRRFLASGRTGFYLKVEREGEVGTGDEITPLSQDHRAISISSVNHLYTAKHYTSDDAAVVKTVQQIDVFPQDWKDYLTDQLTLRTN